MDMFGKKLFFLSLSSIKNRLLIAISTAGLFIVSIGLICGLFFESSDDYGIMYTVAGYYTGEPYSEISFMNTLFLKFFCVLYEFCNSIPWYGLYSVLIMWLSTAAVAYCILTFFERYKLSIAYAILTIYIILSGLFMYSINHLQFTVISASIGTAGVALIITADERYDKKNIMYIYYILSVFCMVLSYLQRPMSGKVVSVFWGIAIIYRFFQCVIRNRKNVKEHIKRFIPILVIFVLSLSVLELVNKYEVKSSEDYDYISSGYNSYRAIFNDYIRPNVTYEEVRDIAESVGWDEDMWDLLYSMFYFDPRWNKNSVTEFVNEYNSTHLIPSFSISNSIKETFNGLSIFIKNSIPAKVEVLIALSMFCGIVFISLNKFRDLWIEFLIGVLVLIISIAMLFYLEYSGRLLLRAAQCVFLPTCIMFMGVFGNCLDYFSFLNKNFFSFYEKTVCLGIILILVLEIPIFSCVLNYNEKENRINLMTSMREIEDYACNHTEDVFVYDFSFGGDPGAYDPFITFENPPINLLHHGGWLVMTSQYNKQLLQNGFKNFAASDYLNDNVYYLTRNPKENPKKNFYSLLTYLDHKLGNVYAKTVDVLDGDVYVIKFCQEKVENNQVDLCGYKRIYSRYNGKILSNGGKNYDVKIVPLYDNGNGGLEFITDNKYTSIQCWINCQWTDMDFTK